VHTVKVFMQTGVDLSVYDKITPAKSVFYSCGGVFASVHLDQGKDTIQGTCAMGQYGIFFLQ
jgi:hypothetical protein